MMTNCFVSMAANGVVLENKRKRLVLKINELIGLETSTKQIAFSLKIVFGKTKVKIIADDRGTTCIPIGCEF